MRVAPDAAGWVRLARRVGAALTSDPEYLPLDPQSGALVVQGAGAAPSATSLYVADGAGSGRLAAVDTSSALLVRDVATSGAGVSANQTPAVPLLADEVFVGPWEQTAGFSEISATIRTDVPSVTDGVAVEFSVDGTDAGLIKRETASVPGGGVGLHFAFQPEAAWFRIRYENGPTAQGYLTAQVMLNVRPGQPSQLPLGASVDDTNTGALGRSTVLGRHSSGAHLPVGATDDRRLTVQDQHAQPLTDAQARATPLPVQTQAGLALDATTDAVRGLLVPVRAGSVRDQGAPWYRAGAGGGSYTLTAGQRLLGLTALARGADGTVTVAGGPAITVRAGASFAWEPRGNYTDGTAVVFSASLDWMVEGVA